jgi:hypothetical protein
MFYLRPPTKGERVFEGSWDKIARQFALEVFPYYICGTETCSSCFTPPSSSSARPRAHARCGGTGWPPRLRRPVHDVHKAPIAIKTHPRAGRPEFAAASQACPRRSRSRPASAFAARGVPAHSSPPRMASPVYFRYLPALASARAPVRAAAARLLTAGVRQAPSQATILLRTPPALHSIPSSADLASRPTRPDA